MFLGTREVAATEHPLASLAALKAFEEGGNAFDAAAAASFALSVVQPQLSGLGGDFFALFYEASSGRYRCLNASGWSPSSFSVEDMRRRGHTQVPATGHASVVVPGYVAGVCEIQRKFGSLELARCVRGARGLAEDGFAVGQGLAGSLARFRESLSPAAQRTFLPGGAVPSVGNLLRQKRLARTLADISEDGAEGFYAGAASRAIREEMAEGGFETTEEDLTSFVPEWCEPLKMLYRGTEVFEIPPNSMGATSLLMLRLLEATDLPSLRPNSAQRVRATVEAAREAYAARDEVIGDPRFSAFDLERFLLSGRSASVQRKLDKADTTYFAVGDSDGNLLSCIQSIFRNFGSMVFVEKGGFFLNNRGSAFRMQGPNKLEPRKRPIHTLSALMLAREGEPIVAVGASGGEYRPQQHALFATNIIDYGMELERAIDYPRFLWDGGDGIMAEEGYTGLDRLRMRCSTVAYPGPTGVAQGVQVLANSLKGVCDIRGEGLPLGE